MSRTKSATKGIQAELEVQLELTKNPDLLVFTPVLGLGMVDIVTLNVKTGEFKAYDVKARSYRLSDVYRNGRKAHPKGSMINRVQTDAQKKLGVEIIYPKEKG